MAASSCCRLCRWTYVPRLDCGTGIGRSVFGLGSRSTLRRVVVHPWTRSYADNVGKRIYRGRRCALVCRETLSVQTSFRTATTALVPGKAQWMSTTLAMRMRMRQQNEHTDAKTSNQNQGKQSIPATSTPDKKQHLLSRLPLAPFPFLQRENVRTLPNLLTLSRLLCAPAIGTLIVYDMYVPALSLLVYAGFTDAVDGYIARRYEMKSVVGTILDPAADKMLMLALTVALMWRGLVPAWLAAIILGRDFLLMLSAPIVRYASLPAPKTLSRFFDVTLPTVEVRPTTISKANTALQLLLLGVSTALAACGIDWRGDGMAWVIVLQYVVATTTVWSGLSYAFSRHAVKFLRPTKPKPKQF